MRILVYTCVFNGYDLVLPPVRADTSVDYVVITEDATLDVSGWRTHVVDKAAFRTAKSPNRHYKMLAHHLLKGYAASVYVDGNIRVLGPLSPLVERFLQSGKALGVYRHPLRTSVAEEVATCESVGKLKGSKSAHDEQAIYYADGFQDDVGLVETGVLLKNHSHSQLDSAMNLWWSLFERFDTRDQISLPYVLWKTGLPVDWQAQSFRDPNPYFGIYPHLGSKHVPARYTYVAARAYDSLIYRAILRLWHARWQLKRRLRGDRRRSR